MIGVLANRVRMRYQRLPCRWTYHTHDACRGPLYAHNCRRPPPIFRRTCPPVEQRLEMRQKTQHASSWTHNNTVCSDVDLTRFRNTRKSRNPRLFLRNWEGLAEARGIHSKSISHISTEPNLNGRQTYQYEHVMEHRQSVKLCLLQDQKNAVDNNWTWTLLKL